MSNSTQGGRGFSGRRDEYSYFERLPPAARRALCDAAFNWASGSVYSPWRRGAPGYVTGPEIAERIAEVDARQIKADRKRVWGLE